MNSLDSHPVQVIEKKLGEKNGGIHEKNENIEYRFDSVGSPLFPNRSDSA
jgi:hypothetical protein